MKPRAGDTGADLLNDLIRRVAALETTMLGHTVTVGGWVIEDRDGWLYATNKATGMVWSPGMGLVVEAPQAAVNTKVGIPNTNVLTTLYGVFADFRRGRRYLFDFATRAISNTSGANNPIAFRLRYTDPVAGLIALGATAAAEQWIVQPASNYGSVTVRGYLDWVWPNAVGVYCEAAGRSSTAAADVYVDIWPSMFRISDVGATPS